MIPIRATIISAIFVLPYSIMYLVFLAVDVDHVIRSGGIRAVLAVITILRCPLTAFVTYQTKMEIVTARKRFVERQERQDIEIQNALMKRACRRLQSNEVEETVF
jgi:hypothetical protein